MRRVRAEYIVRELLANPRPGIPATPSARLPVPAPPKPIASLSRWRISAGALGLGIATVLFVASLAIRLDDGALLLALSLFLWGGRLILEDGPVPA